MLSQSPGLPCLSLLSRESPSSTFSDFALLLCTKLDAELVVFHVFFLTDTIVSIQFLIILNLPHKFSRNVFIIQVKTFSNFNSDFIFGHELGSSVIFNFQMFVLIFHWHYPVFIKKWA